MQPKKVREPKRMPRRTTGRSLTSLNTTREVQRATPRLALLPIGATEQHSLHLPLATDALIVEAVALGAAEKLNAYCLPVLPFSVSHMMRGQRGTVWLRNRTLMAVVRDLAVSLRHEGFRQLAIVNCHGGNHILLPTVQDLNLDFPDFLAFSINIWEPVAGSGIFKRLGNLCHGDEFETACLLHLNPASVKRQLIRDQPSTIDRELLLYRPFIRLSRLTHAGHPSEATAEQGRQAIRCMVDHVVVRIRKLTRRLADL